MTMYHAGCCLNSAQKFSIGTVVAAIRVCDVNLWMPRPALIVWGIHFYLRQFSLFKKIPLRCLHVFTWALNEPFERAGYTSDDPSQAVETGILGTEEESVK